MSTLSNDFVDRIDEILVKRNLKRKALADFVGFSTQSITDWSKRGNFPAADTALKIAEYLGVSVEWLITGITKSNELSPEILQHVDYYRALDTDDQKVVDNLVESLLARYTRGGQTDESEKRLG